MAENKTLKAIKRIGLLGLGSRSTVFYLEQFNTAYNTRMGGYSTCPLVLLNSDFNEFNPYLPDQFSILVPALKKYLNALSDLAVRKIIIPNITLHECYDHINKDLSINASSIVHPVTETIKKLQDDGHTQVVIFGSRYSINSTTLHDTFSSAGITLIIPHIDDIDNLEHLRQLVYTHQESAEDIKSFHQLIKQYQVQAPIVIACTELSVVLPPAATILTPYLYDMANIQIEHGLAEMA
ncbi:MAG: aspartate racemase [Kiritimatiellia bacterium]|jgi:aspartate racemase